VRDRALDAAFAELAIVPERIEPLPSRALGVRPGAYRAETREWGQIKIRVGHRRRTVERALGYVELLGDPRLPRPLARSGRVTVEAWVEGRTLADCDERESLDGAARLLAAIHGFQRARVQRDQSVAPIRRRLLRQLDELVEARLIDRAAATRLERLADALPATARVGLLHGDFCGENLVCRRDGVVVSIDNAHLHLGFLQYELGRSWYRWQHSPRAAEHVEGRYRELTGLGVDAAERTAWRTAATVKGLHLRHRHRWPLELPRSALARLLA
jgi:thiamine kinase-like enzyme